MLKHNKNVVAEGIKHQKKWFTWVQHRVLFAYSQIVCIEQKNSITWSVRRELSEKTHACRGLVASLISDNQTHFYVVVIFLRLTLLSDMSVEKLV